MTTNTLDRIRSPRDLAPDSRYRPVLVTLGLLVVTFAIGTMRYDGFLSTQVVLNLFVDNAFLIVLAVGMTFVILSGGIDLSVGAVLAFSTMLAASLAEVQGWSAWLVMPVVLAVGSLFGLAMGVIIHYFEIQPFIVTLAGMFIARGLSYVISLDAISITDPTFTSLAQSRIALPGATFISPSVVIAVVVVAVAAVVLQRTPFGRTVYAVGGNRQSAMLMGLQVARSRVGVYVISGFCSSLGGLLLSLYMLSGYGSHAVGMELDAIAAVVIGGTLLTGGSGFVIGSLLGVLVLGTIQTIITFEGTLSSWWTKIVIGALLLVFIVVQRLGIGATDARKRREDRPG